MQGTGKPLKETESYSYLFTDSVHKAFDRAAQSARTFACAVIALSDSFACPSTMAASFSLPPHVEAAQRAGVSLPEGRPGTEFAYWRQDANFQVEQIPPEYRLTIYERVLMWEKKLATIRGACVACVFPDGYEGANKIGSGQVPIGDVVDTLITRKPTGTLWRWSKTSLLPCLGLSNAHRKMRPILSLLATRHLPWLRTMTTLLCVRVCPSVSSSSGRSTPFRRSGQSTRLKWGKGLSAINHQVLWCSYRVITRL